MSRTSLQARCFAALYSLSRNIFIVQESMILQVSSNSSCTSATLVGLPTSCNLSFMTSCEINSFSRFGVYHYRRWTRARIIKDADKASATPFLPLPPVTWGTEPEDVMNRSISSPWFWATTFSKFDLLLPKKWKSTIQPCLFGTGIAMRYTGRLFGGGFFTSSERGCFVLSIPWEICLPNKIFWRWN